MILNALCIFFSPYILNNTLNVLKVKFLYIYIYIYNLVSFRKVKPARFLETVILCEAFRGNF